MQNYFLNKNITLFFLLLSLSFLILRFFLPFFYYPQEDILIKYIFELKGGSYLPLIHSYSNFTFSPSYGLENEFGNKNLAFPYLALFIPSILLKVFGPFSYIIIEFFATTLFLIIFYRILILLKFNNLSAIVISCFLFLLPSIIRELDYSINNEIISIVNSNVKSFYGLRVPRPLITNLYFFFFLLILIKIDKDKKYTIKRSLLMGVLVGLSIHALFLLALIEFFILLSYLILNYKKLEEKRNEIPFDIDGIVYKINNFSLQNRLGFAANAPRWAIAHKFSANSSISEILNIEIQIGRTGALTPVAKIKPVNIGGVVVSNATLHNEDEIVRKDIRIGDTVTVERAGDVIPHVISVNLKKREKNSKKFIFPLKCPSCNSKTIKDFNLIL